DAFVPPSATYYDLFDDAADTSAVTAISSDNITSNVDTSTPGNYTVTYTASDASGNEATKNLTVIVEPDYQDEIVLFSNGSLAEGWRQNGYDVDLSYGDCPGNTCPNLDYGIENDPTKGRDVMYIDHGVDNAAQAGFFMQTELNVDPIDLRGAEVNGILTFEVWSDSPDGVDLNVAVDCPAYPNAGSPVLLEGVGAEEWQEISIPASSLFNQACALRSDQIGTIPMFLSRWMGPKIRIDNVIWKCEFSCGGSDIPDAEYTPWVKADKTAGYDAPTSYTGYDLVWSDEFDGTAVDQTKWNLENAGGGFGNSELQYYRPENASVEDGLLVITADIQQSDDAELPGGESFSSAKLTTQDKLEFKHGRVDIRAAVAEGKGMWSAGWMLGANVDDIGWPFAGEIDIVETIGGVTYGVDQENRMVHNAYWNAEGPFAPGQYLTPRQFQDAKYSPTPSGQSTAWGERELVTEGETFSNTFHVFSIEWDEEKIRYMIDGVYVEGRDLDLTTNVVAPCPHGQVANEPQLSCLGQSYDNDFFLILNVAVGGTFPGAPDSNSKFPRGMLVDYVRVYQNTQGNTSPIVSNEPGSGDADPVEPGTGTEAGGEATFTGTFDGFLANSETNTFEFPASAQSWAGVANDNQALYPLTFPTNTTLNFLASSDEPVTVKFTFEYNPYPDVNPTFSTDEVVVNGDCQAYSVDITAQGSDTFSNFMMFIIERDIPVTVSNVVIGGVTPSCDVANEPEPNDSTVTPLNITKTSNAAGMEFLGLGCEIGLNGLLDDDICPSPNDIVSSQVAYISNSTMSGKQKVVTVSYTSDDSSTTGLGIRIHFDSSEMTLSGASNAFTTDRISPDISTDTIFLDTDDFDGNAETDKFVIGSWASLFGQWPGSFDETGKVNLFTLTFDINTKNQFVSVSGNPEGVFGKKVPVNIGYSVSDFNNQLTGLGVRVHFNSNLLSISDVTNILPKDLITPAYGPVADEENYDNDDSTDVYITFGWASLYGEWTDQTLPTNIATIEFDVINQHNNEDYEFTNINFTANSTPPDYNFVPENYTLPLLLATWDFDGSGNIDALTDGLLLLRYSFGMRGQALTNNVVASSTSLSHEEVALSLEDSIQIADIDGDGKVDALTDGLLLLRYMFGLRDEILIDQAVSASAQRNNKELITNYIEKHMPKN
ncbi:MAG: family 16 glycosylhydrolase, partial [Porticoccaceae bacterium]